MIFCGRQMKKHYSFLRRCLTPPLGLNFLQLLDLWLLYFYWYLYFQCPVSAFLILRVCANLLNLKHGRSNPNKYREGSRANGNAGKILGVIGLILTVIYWVLIVIFTAVAVNEYERSNYNDLDGDYIEDSEDNDIDGDGFNNNYDCCPYDEYNH